MATNDGDFRYPPLTGDFDIPTRRRIPHPPRLDPLRINPPSRPSTPGGGPQPSYSQRPPPMPRKYPAYPALDDPFVRAASPQPPRNEDLAMGHPVYQRTPTFPLAPHERSPKPYTRAKTPERPSHRNLSPIQPPLRTSRSTSRLNGRPPKAHRSHDRQLNDQYALALPRSHPYGSPDSQGDDTLRSSVNSAMTSRSSIEQASGTERSSVLTKSSSITDLSPDTPDAPYNEKDGGMSVEDAISMYLDGFSDVTEEPTSPDFRDDAKLRPLSPPRPPTALTLDDGHTSDEHSPDMDPVKDLPPVPPLTSLNPPDQNQLDGPFLGEAESGVKVMTDPLEQTPSNPGLGIAYQETKIRVRGEVPPPLLLDTESRDRYGFRKANHHVTLQQYETWSAGYADFLANRRVKWSELLREHNLPTSDPTVFPVKSSKVKRFVRKGIPSEFRGAAWFWYAGGYEHLNRNPGLYDRLVQQAMESPSNDDKEHIERDLHRTFPDNIHFKPENADELCKTGASSGSSPPKQGSVTVETDMIQSLRRVLYAFALHSPQVGYTQSLNFITGMLLLFLPEEKAFWMLHVITSVYLPGTHEISLEGANIDLWILMVLLRDSMPHLYNKITGTGTRAKTPPLTVHSRLPDITLGLTNWLMSVFIGTLPLETTLRVWDVFFYEGSKTFFRVSLAIFKACERDILAVSDPMEVFQVIQTVPKKLLDANALLDDCFVRRHRVGQGRIEELRLSRRTAVRQDKLRRSIAMSKGQLQAATDEWTTPRSRTPIPGIERSLADSWRHMKHHAFR